MKNFMSIVLFLLFFNIVISSTDKSDCQLKTANSNPGGRRLVSLLEDKDCNNLSTTKPERYNCVVSSDGDKCIEEPKSECYAWIISDYDRRLSSELSADDCKELETTSSKKKCVLSEDRQSCTEVDFSFGLNINKLSIFAFCLLFFL